jgi:MFS family permease
MTFKDSLAPLRSARFRWFFAGRTLSLFGNAMVPIALAFAVLDLTGEASDLGLVLAARSIPMVGFIVLGGIVADRMSRSLLLQLSHTGAALTQGAVAVLLISGSAELWMLIGLEFANGVLFAFSFPALQGAIPQVADRRQLQPANAILAFSRNASMVVGPSIAGLLVVSVGSGWAIAYDALSFGLAAYCMSRLRLTAQQREEPTSMLYDLREGWTAFTSRTWVWVVVAAFGVLNLIHAGVWFTLGPTIARDTIGEGQWGLVLSAEAVGFVVMSLILLRVSLRYPLRAGMIGMTSLCLPMAMLGLEPQVVVLVATAFLAGAGTELFGIGWQVALHEHIPGDVLSRVSSYDVIGSLVAVPIGQILAGPLAEVWGQREVVVVASGIYLGIGLATLLSRSVRNLERAVTEPDDVSPRPAVDATT